MCHVHCHAAYAVVTLIPRTAAASRDITSMTATATTTATDTAACPFDQVLDRRHTNSEKWDGIDYMLTPEQRAADPLPMWVADADFKAPRPVVDALHDIVEAGVFGYPATASPAYLSAVTDWQFSRFGWRTEPEWVVQSAGVLTALKTIVQAFSSPGDAVLVQPPVYSHFYDDVALNDRRTVSAPLRQTPDGRYEFDAEAFAAAITPDTKLFFLSNPHNPTGNVFSPDELRTMGRICADRGVLVVADEIHQDLVLNPAKRHTPFASLSPEFEAASITCTAASKTFNLPGLQCANIFIPDAGMRERFRQQYKRNLSPDINPLGTAATQAAYTHGEPWLTELLDYVRGNHAYFATHIADIPGLRVVPGDSLYLAWLDCRGLDMDAHRLTDFLLRRARLWFDEGQKFGAEGHGFMRVNLACPRATVTTAVDRLANAVAGLRSVQAGEAVAGL